MALRAESLNYSLISVRLNDPGLTLVTQGIALSHFHNFLEKFHTVQSVHLLWHLFLYVAIVLHKRCPYPHGDKNIRASGGAHICKLSIPSLSRMMIMGRMTIFQDDSIFMCSAFVDACKLFDHMFGAKAKCMYL